MKSLITLCMVAIGLLITVNAQSQDEIHKKDGTILYVKVIEIGMDGIKYISPVDSTVLIELDKATISKLVMNGQEEIIHSGMDDPALYADQRTRAVKFNFLSPMSNYYLEVGYEQSLAPGRSLDFNAGFIGVGMIPWRLDYGVYNDYLSSNVYYYSVDEESVRGFFLRGGYKFINTPDFAMRGMRYSHLLKGGYIKPELHFGNFYYDETRTDEFGNGETLKNQGEVYGALVINLGKQWVFSDIFLIDISAGVGYGFSTNEDVNGAYSLLINRREGFGAAFRSTLNIGILLD